MGTKGWHLLLVAEGEPARRAVRQALAASKLPAEVAEVDRAAEARARLPPPGEDYDCLIIDCSLDRSGGETLIRDLRARGVVTPILVVMSQADADEAAEEALSSAGASDYLPRQDLQPDRLARRLRHVIRGGRAEANYAAALATAQRAVQDRDDLLSILSHDLRTPLNAIRIAADELIDPNLDAAERKVMVSAVQRSLRRADRLICDMLDVSRIEAGTLALSRTAVSAKELLEQARNEHALQSRDGGLTLQLAVDAEVGMVLADRERILQVLENLLSNAARHGRGSGAVTLTAAAKKDKVEISVIDGGPGIPADQLPYLFDRFYQARHQHRAAAGLGLSIVKGIVAAHGGTIAVSSVVGKGTSFTFSLPRAD